MKNPSFFTLVGPVGRNAAGRLDRVVEVSPETANFSSRFGWSLSLTIRIVGFAVHRSDRGRAANQAVDWADRGEVQRFVRIRSESGICRSLTKHKRSSL